MILDSLDNSAMYEQMHPLFKKAFDFIKTTDLTTLPLGKTLIEGEDLFINVVEMEPKSKPLLELHRKYIDIQVPFTSHEKYGYKKGELCVDEAGCFDEEKDMGLFNDEYDCIVEAKNDQFIIFYPNDGHAPGMSNDALLKKAILKVKI